VSVVEAGGLVSLARVDLAPAQLVGQLAPWIVDCQGPRRTLGQRSERAAAILTGSLEWWAQELPQSRVTKLRRRVKQARLQTGGLLGGRNRADEKGTVARRRSSCVTTAQRERWYALPRNAATEERSAAIRLMIDPPWCKFIGGWVSGWVTGSRVFTSGRGVKAI